MPAATALGLCPQAIVLRPRMSHYAEIADQIRATFHRYTPLVEALPLDDAFLDVAGCDALFGPSGWDDTGHADPPAWPHAMDFSDAPPPLRRSASAVEFA